MKKRKLRDRDGYPLEADDRVRVVTAPITNDGRHDGTATVMGDWDIDDWDWNCFWVGLRFPPGGEVGFVPEKEILLLNSSRLTRARDARP